jgi:FkbM family methyltransferase
MFRAIKTGFRRWQLARRGIVSQLTVNTFTAGARSGVWTVCPDFLAPDSVVYSVGVGDNIAWELALMDRFGLTVHAFDPTPASVAWIAHRELPPRFRFHPLGLAGHDGTLHFAAPRRGSPFNYRPMANSLAPGRNMTEAPVCRLTTLLRQLGHDHLDLLKMDIEGGEYAVLDDLLASSVPVRQLLVEFHHHLPGIGIARTEQAVRALEQAGYRIFHISDRSLEFSFLYTSTLIGHRPTRPVLARSLP